MVPLNNIMFDRSNTINVIYQFNEKYVPYAGVSITSLLVNNTGADKINIYVLGEGLTESSKNMLSKVAAGYGATVIFPDTVPLITRFRELGMLPYRGAYSVYLRLFFMELQEMSELAGKRAVYLDADTIVDGSLIPLLNHDLEGKSIGMVLESIRDDYKTMIGMSPDSDYYNSGVILFDVDMWRKNKYCDRLVDHIRNVRNSYIGDQDFLNIVCEGDVCKLPPTFNFQPLHARYTNRQYFRAYGRKGYYTLSQLADGQKGAIIYHCYRWLGDFPWNTGNLHPFSSVYEKYKGLSLWKDRESDKSEKGMALWIERFLFRLLPRAVFIFIFKWTHELILKRAEKDAKNRKTNPDA